MIGNGQNLHRNFSMVAWAVRKHLDYNTDFNFQVRTESDELNAQIEKLMWEWQLPYNCDASARFTFPQLIRMAEARRTIDGDFFFLKRNNGTLNAVEADLIQDPEFIPNDGQRWFNGGRVNKDGRPVSWGLYSRELYGKYKYLRNVPAKNMVHLCAYDRFDQVRGISPLTSAYNSFRDCYEGVDYALAKMKVEQLFAMVVHSTSGSGTGEYTRQGDGTYEVDFGKGPVKLEMDADDDAKFLTSDNPGSNTQEFIQLVLSMAVKSLDLPMCFIDESHTNFFGSKSAFMLYDRSCKPKRDVMRETLRKITVWKLQQWIIEGKLSLPEGQTVLDLPFEWVHVGMPWWDPQKEISGDLMAMQAGLDTPQRICKERGRGEFEDNLKQLAKAKELAESYGLNLTCFTEEIPEEPEDEELEDDEEIIEEESDDDSE
jgi:capsid protein